MWLWFGLRNVRLGSVHCWQFLALVFSASTQVTCSQTEMGLLEINRIYDNSPCPKTAKSSMTWPVTLIWLMTYTVA